MENDWVEINLPWCVSNPTNDLIKSLGKEQDKYYKRFEKEFKKKYGVEWSEYSGVLNDTLYTSCGYAPGDFANFVEELDTIAKKYPLIKQRVENEPLLELLATCKNKRVRTIAEAFIASNTAAIECDDWSDKNDNYIKCQEYRRLLYIEEKKEEGFYSHPMRKPGVLIEVLENGEKKQYLIGHINESCGVCDDCTMFDKDTVVLRAKIVWEHE
jgi:hypothetical protein